MNRLPLPPEESAADLAYSVGKLIADLGHLGTAYEAVVARPYASRQKEWFTQVAIVVNELERRLSATEKKRLANNPKFLSVVVQASQIAMRQHTETKRRELLNTIANAGLDPDMDADVQTMFMQYTDRLTAWHIRALKFFHDPRSVLVEHKVEWTHEYRLTTVSLTMVISRLYPELALRSELFEKLYVDLRNDGLVESLGLLDTVDVETLLRCRSTSHGKDYLAFISEPHNTTQARKSA